MRAAAVARVSPLSRPAAARPARLRAIARRTIGPNGESGGRASGGLARVGGPTRVVCLARASSRDEGGVGPSDDDASSNARAWVAKTRVERGSNAALSVGGDDEKDHENEESRDAARLAPFVVDDATSAWVLCRFAFIWVVFGYVAVPAYALLVETPVMDLSPKTQAAALLASEAGKLVATNAMLDAELGPARTPRRRCFRSAENVPVPFAALWNTHDVALGVACGALASVAARAADGITHGISAGDETVAAASSSALDLFLSIRGDPFALVAAATASALVAPAAEELFFRGFLLPTVCESARRNGRGKNLGKNLGEGTAVAVVAATFAAAHFSPSDFPALFVAGAVFGVASLGSRTRGGLVAPFLAHAIFNALVLAEYLSLS